MHAHSKEEARKAAPPVQTEKTGPFCSPCPFSTSLVVHDPPLLPGTPWKHQNTLPGPPPRFTVSQELHPGCTFLSHVLILYFVNLNETTLDWDMNKTKMTWPAGVRDHEHKTKTITFHYPGDPVQKMARLMSLPPAAGHNNKRPCLHVITPLYSVTGWNNMTLLIIVFPWQPWVIRLDDCQAVKLWSNIVVTVGRHGTSTLTFTHPPSVKTPIGQK